MNNTKPDYVARVVAVVAPVVVWLAGVVWAAVIAPVPAPVPTPDVVIVDPVPTPVEYLYSYVERDGSVVDAPQVIAVADQPAGSYRVTRVPRSGIKLESVITIGGQPVPPTPKPDPPKPEPPKPIPAKATSVTYVYDFRSATIPPAVLSGLNRLNREKKIIATLYEDDNTNGKNEVPAQYKLALEAAKKAGMPALVVTDGVNVLAVVKSPATEDQVLEAVR
jgi:hypothetical protein